MAFEPRAIVEHRAQRLEEGRERQDDDGGLEPLRRGVQGEVDTAEEHEREEHEVGDGAVGLRSLREARQREAERHEAGRSQRHDER